MLAELAAANAAFAVIKQTVSHGKDLMSAGKAISKLVDAEEDLRARGNKKKNSFQYYHLHSEYFHKLDSLSL